VARQFKKAHGHAPTPADIDRMFDMFRPTMAEVAVTEALIRPFDGVREAIRELQSRGIKVGCDTGYPKETCDVIYGTLDRKFGIKFDVVADSENVRGRPTPFLVYDCMYKANAYPPAAVIKADDITAGVEEGANSGAWTVGICETGAHDAKTLKKAGAHFLIPGARDIPALIDAEIAPRLKRGEIPGEAAT
jgi:phosphonoacetaldehyde hydrolase